MYKKFFTIWMVLIISSIGLPVLAQDSICCSDPICSAKVKQLITNLEKETRLLGSCPEDFKARKEILDKLKIDKPASFDNLKKAVSQLHNWYINDISRRICVTRHYAEMTDDALNWFEFIMSLYYIADFRSPEFAKGFGFHANAAMGSIDAFKTSERYVLTGGVLISYTFTPKGRVTGGHTRLMLGPSIFYSRQDISLMANPRIEFRLKDIGNEMTSLGCFKFIAQGNIGRKMMLAGIGGSIELSRFAIDITLDNDFKNKDFYLKIGMMYSTFFKRNK